MANVDEAGDVLEVGELVLEIVVKGAEPTEESEVVDRFDLDGDQDRLVATVAVAKGVVGGADRIVLGEHALRRGVDLERGQLTGQRRHADQYEGGGRPGVAIHEAPELAEAGLDGVAEAGEPALIRAALHRFES